MRQWKWKEQAKTVLFTLLVLSSFVLTTILWSNQPEFQLIEPAKYVKSKPVQSKELKELISPEAVIYHFGEDRHTKAYSNGAHYRIIKPEMSKWIFFDFVTYSLTDEKWEQLTQKNIGIEIQYRSSIPMSILSRQFTFRDENYNQIKQVDRLWLYYEEKEEMVYALFISNEDQQVVRARTVVSPKDLRESYLPPAKPLPEQILKAVKNERDFPTIAQGSTFWEIYYLPKGPMKMTQFLYNYLPITYDELIEAYFLDGSLVRQIEERDGTIIFTDGSRSIQLQPEQQVISFTDPAFQQGRKDLSDEERVKSSVMFINNHLGWTDDYHFESIKESNNEKHLITFRQYLGAYPLISKDGHRLDEITIGLESGQVVKMNRSLIDLDRYIDNREWVVMSGPELFNLIRENKLADTSKITNAYLVYQANVHQGYIELTPTWVVELSNQSRLTINARSLQGGGKVNGLE